MKTAFALAVMAIFSSVLNVVAGGPVVPSKEVVTPPHRLPHLILEQMSWIWEHSLPTERILIINRILEELATTHGEEAPRSVISRCFGQDLESREP